MANGHTESTIFDRLADVFPSPGYVVLPQVRNATGFARNVRTADAIVCSTWPSRGLWLAGVEIKVSLGDWRRELAQPEKADGIGRYCDYWYVAAPRDVVPVGEVPETWGLIEIGKRAKIVRRAEKLNPEPLAIKFLASVLRSAAACSVPAASIESRVEAVRLAAYQQGEQNAKSKVAYETERVRNVVKSFEVASGIKLHGWDATDIGKAVKFVREHRLHHTEQWLHDASREARLACEHLDAATQAMKAEAEVSNGE